MTDVRRRHQQVAASEGFVSLDSPSAFSTPSRGFSSRYIPYHPTSPSASSTDTWASSYSSPKSKEYHVSNHTQKWLIILGVALIVVPWMSHLNTYNRITSLTKAIEALQLKRKALTKDLRKSRSSVKKLKEDTQKFEEENKDMLKKLREAGDEIDPENNAYTEAETLEEGYMTRIDQLERTIQKRSAYRLLQNYGEGPYRVKFTLDEPFDIHGDSFVIETTRRDVMPHAIEHFLEMVKRQLWDGQSIHHRNEGSNLLHILTLDGTTKEWSEAKFREANLTKLAFAEHSSLYPVQKYSVAFKGRPGGPELFVNLDKLFRTSEADFKESCFAQVTEGRALLDALVKTPSGRMMSIKSVRILASSKDSRSQSFKTE